MKLSSLILGIAVVGLVGKVAAQEETPQEKECKRMRFLAGEENKVKNFAAATTYYLKGETICGNYDKANYGRLIGTVKNTIITETDKTKKVAYIDTLMAVYERAESKKLLEPKDMLDVAKYSFQSSKPNKTKIDEIYRNHITSGSVLTEEQINLYFNNLIKMYNEAVDAPKLEFKKRIISDYFMLSKMIEANSYTVKTQETLTATFNQIVRTCDDILPELGGFMKSLPQDVEAKKKAVNNFMNLLKEKGCTGSKEYEMLVDTIIKIDNTVDAVLAKAGLLRAKKKFADAIGVYNQAKGMSTDPVQKEEIEFNILEIQYHDQNSFQSAYRTAMGISGANRSKALMIAANCVAKTANSCGSSTFERRCNYLYAAELAQRAGDGGAATRFRASGPTSEDIFNNNNPSSVSLSCWGVSVSTK